MRFARLLFSMLCLPALSLAYDPTLTDQESNRQIDAVLGISDTFGKWTSTMWIGYDPDGAPALFNNNAHVIDLLNTAIAEWKRVSGVDMQVIGIDSTLADDSALAPEKNDFTVRVSWSPLVAGNKGRAGPSSGYYDQNVGFASYIDGSLELNNVQGEITSDGQMVNVMVHELGHLLGLGHSDNPVSVMYANPYNGLYHPREDDIRAVQALYGPPILAIDASKSFLDWTFSVPAAASASVTQYLFKANQATSNGAYFP